MGHVNLTKKSKHLALVLRHDPKSIGISMDSNGWVSVLDLCKKMPIELADLEEIVRTDSKGRYSFSDDKSKIRANQGHSIEVDVQLKEAVPPEFLYHGTGKKSVDSIYKDGLKKMSRLHVHLSDNPETAVSVGSRHGVPVVFKVHALEMYEQGHVFYRSENGVWLTDHVPPKFLRHHSNGS